MKIHNRFLYILGFLCLLAFNASASPTLEIEEDHDEVMEAVQQGLIQPFSALQAKVNAQLNGRIIRVELEEDDDIWIYDLKLLDPHNNIVRVEYEARTLSIIEIKGRGLENIIKVSE
ncbi:hypothetical protein L4D76_23320 [Photobacterium sagamiensis]|uniref:PepSY domain-containing protein n=1 Tax=Photobacterium sagamiensis TaxID=2910241 RepID=UPI003D107790